MKKSGFTLVELLAVLVILAVILVIAVPKVISIIKDVRIGALESTAKLVALSAEKKKIENNIVGNDVILTCENVVKINDVDYESCYIEFIENKAIVTIIGKGTFKGMNACEATKNNANITDRCLNKKVEVKLELNDGSATDITGIYKEGTVIDLETPIKENSTFIRYEVVSGNSTISNNKLTVGSTNTIIHTIYESWPSLDIDLDGGISSTNQNGVYKSDSIIELDEPTKEGYTFTGWTLENNMGLISGNILTMGSEDTKVKANYIVNIYKVTFNANGGYIENNVYDDASNYIYNVPISGEYKLEVWGAQGGNIDIVDMENISHYYSGGYGAYSHGNIILSRGDKLFIVIGGKGNGNCVVSKCIGGYNGGGDSGVSTEDKKNYTASGGGATHIAIYDRGELKNFKDNKEDLIIVAGGGGGAYYHTFGDDYSMSGGSGGGFNGCDGILSGYNSLENKEIPAATGGTQISGGLSGYRGDNGYFGLGGSGKSCDTTKCGSSGGGGGYYGGGASGHSGTGGGSGYIGNILLTEKAMYCYKCDTSTIEKNVTYQTENISSEPKAYYAKKDDGAAKISLLVGEYNYEFDSVYNNLPKPNRQDYIFVGWNTKNDGTGIYINNDSILNIPQNHTLYAIWKND